MNNQPNKIGGKLLHWAAETWRFLSSLFFLKNFAKMIGVLLFFFFLLNMGLRCYTRHGDQVKVQDFIGMNLKDAKKQSRKNRFKFVITDSTDRPELKPHTILEQNPKPESPVKKDRTIYVEVARFTRELIKLPSFKDHSYDGPDYRKSLHRKGLKTKIRDTQFSSKYADSTILHLYYKDEKITESQVNSGFEVPSGELIELVVSAKNSPTVEVPNLICKTYSAAQFLLTSSRLTIGEVIEDATVSNRNSAFVWKQSPDYYRGNIIQKESRVNLYLTQSRPEGCSLSDN